MSLYFQSLLLKHTSFHSFPFPLEFFQILQGMCSSSPYPFCPVTYLQVNYIYLVSDAVSFSELMHRRDNMRTQYHGLIVLILSVRSRLQSPRASVSTNDQVSPAWDPGSLILPCSPHLLIIPTIEQHYFSLHKCGVVFFRFVFLMSNSVHGKLNVWKCF